YPSACSFSCPLPHFCSFLSVCLLVSPLPPRTFVAPRSTAITNEEGVLREAMRLPGTTPHMFNVSLAYNQSKFKIRLSSNFAGAYIDEIGGNSFEDRYYDKQLFLDLNLSYAVTPNLSL